jgi:Predicted oxidoreductases (related to aryl-alcohol dehydrogenases)
MRNKAGLSSNEALELGINFFDTANMYGTGRSEEVWAGRYAILRNGMR